MTIQEQYELLEKTVRGYNPSADFAQIRAAFDYADKCHEGQKRKSGEPYIIHPLAVAQIVAEELKLDSESIEAAPPPAAAAYPPPPGHARRRSTAARACPACSICVYHNGHIIQIPTQIIIYILRALYCP